jgi:hypothetical protein
LNGRGHTVCERLGRNVSDVFRFGLHEHVFQSVHQARFFGCFRLLVAPRSGLIHDVDRHKIMGGLVFADQKRRIPQEHQKVEDDRNGQADAFLLLG